MTTTETVTLTFVVEINGPQAMREFNAEWESHGTDGSNEVPKVDEREHLTRAVSRVAAKGFFSHKSESGLQIRSIMLVE